jgi:hypothetical protein
MAPPKYDTGSATYGGSAGVEQRKDVAQVESTQGSAASSQQNARRSSALLPADVRKANALADKAVIDADKAKAKAAAEDTLKRIAALKKASDVGDLLYNVQQARKNITPTATGMPGQTLRNFWGTDAANLQASLTAVLAPTVLENLRAAKEQSAAAGGSGSGFGALSERELDLLQSSIASLKQAQSEDQLMENLNRIEMHFRRFQAYNAGLDPDKPEVAVAAGLAPPAETPAGTISAKGGMVDDPKRKGMNAQIDIMIRAGRTPAEIRAYADTVEPGLGARLQSVDEAVSHWKRFGAAPGIDTERNFVPAPEGVSKEAGKALLTPAGAFVTGAADVMSGGTMDEIAGAVPGATRADIEARMKGVQDEHPGYAAAGGMAGGVAQTALLGPLAARYGLPPAATDFVMNTGYGAGSSQPGDRVSGGAIGATTGFLGDVGIKGVTRMGGSMMRGAGSNAARFLHERGVPLTIGQTTGGQLKNWEDKKLNWPIVGPVFKQRRREAYEGFNLAAFSEALAPINGQVTQAAEGGITEAQQQVSAAYQRALSGTTLHPDTPFLSSVLGADRAALARAHRVGNELTDQLDEIVRNAVDPATGQISGEAFQIARRELNQLMKSYKTDPQYNQRIGPALNRIEQSFDDMFTRQVPDRAETYLAANSANRHVSILEDAVLGAGAPSGGIFTPAQLRAKSVANTKIYGSKRQAAAGRRPFYELDRAGREVMPSAVPDSGTPGGLLPIAVGLTTAAGGTGLSAANRDEGESVDLSMPLLAAGSLAAIAGGPYSRRGQTIGRTMFGGSNSPAVRNLGRMTNQYLAPGFAGAARPFTAGALVDRVPSPEATYQEPKVIPGAPPVVEPEEAPPPLPPGTHLGPNGEIVPDEEPVAMAYGGAVRDLSRRYNCGGRVHYASGGPVRIGDIERRR